MHSSPYFPIALKQPFSDFVLWELGLFGPLKVSGKRLKISRKKICPDRPPHVLIRYKVVLVPGDTRYNANGFSRSKSQNAVTCPLHQLP